jgi:hypothetical protein
MIIAELRTLLNGFPSEATVSLVVENKAASYYSDSIAEANYDVDVKVLVLKGWEL